MYYGRYRLLLCILIGLVPSNYLRILLYNLLFGYKISPSSRIGFLTVIMVKSAVITDATIGVFNFFRGPFDLEIEEGSSVNSFNRIECATWILQEKFKNSNYAASCKLSKNSLITDRHFIDTTGGFELGEGSWIAGRDSQFWTHGAGASDTSIIIGKDVYIGSGSKFAPGSSIGDNNIVSLGSVVTKKFDVNYCLIGGNPAKIVKENYDWKSRETSNKEKTN